VYLVCITRVLVRSSVAPSTASFPLARDFYVSPLATTFLNRRRRYYHRTFGALSFSHSMRARSSLT